MSEPLDKLIKEFIGRFKKSVLPAIKAQIESRDKAQARVDELVSRVESISQNILDLDNELEAARKAVVTADDHQEPVSRIIKLKEQVKVLQEIKEEIETKTLNDCRMELDKEQQALQQAALYEIEKIKVKERKEIISILTDVRLKVDAFNDARILFAQDPLKLPPKYNLGGFGAFDLYIEGLRNLDLS